MGIALFFILILTAVTFIPKWVVVLLILNLLVGIVFSCIQIVIAFLPNFKPRPNKLKRHPFVSILVPAYNEPPAILTETLEALSHLKYDCFEVLIIDNNTRDARIWKPVEAFTKTLGKKFRFFHVDGLQGFKAGALNHVLKYVDKKSEYAAVIDADYLVRADFLNIALSFFSNKDIGLVQFPQRYRNCTKENRPVSDEYNHFFEIYMNMANHLDCVPSTGTVSVYDLAILSQIGGFRGEALTEDADVGLRIYEAGYRGIYVDQPMGLGLMPYDLEAYRKQKWRWSFGNAQSLKTLFLLFGKIPFRSWIGFLSHLTAWHHFHFLPFAALAAFPVILLPSISTNHYYGQILVFAALSIFTTLVSKFIIFLIILRKQKNFFIRALQTFVVHMGMTLVYSGAWVAYIFQRKIAFERTNKFVLKKMPNLIKNSYGELILGIWYLLGAAAAILWGSLIVAGAFIVAAAVLFSIYYAYWKIKPTKQYSKEILSVAEHKYQNFLLQD